MHLQWWAAVLYPVDSQVNISAVQHSCMNSSHYLHPYVDVGSSTVPEPSVRYAVFKCHGSDRRPEEKSARWNPGKVTHILLYWLHPQQRDGCKCLAGNAATSWPQLLLPASSSVPLCFLSCVSSSLSEPALLLEMCWWEMSAPLVVDRAHVQIVWLEWWCLRHGPSCRDT